MYAVELLQCAAGRDVLVVDVGVAHVGLEPVSEVRMSASMTAAITHTAVWPWTRRSVDRR